MNRSSRARLLLALIVVFPARGVPRAPRASTGTRTLWIDTDPSGLVDLGMDVDDDLALAILLRSNVRVGGISTTYGNAPTRFTTPNAQAVVRAMGMDVPVHAGAECAFPLASLCAKRLRNDAASNASRALVEHLLVSPPNSVTVVALGPLTNVAAALADPRVDAKHAPLAIFVVGGTMTLPWERSVREEAVSSFYFRADPASLNAVMAYSLSPKVAFTTQTMTHTPLNDATMESTLSALCDSTADTRGIVGDAQRYFACAYRDRLATERIAHRWASVFSAKETSGVLPPAIANFAPKKKKKRPKKKGVRDAKPDDVKRFLSYRATIYEARRGSFLFDLSVVAVLLEPNAIVREWSKFPVAAVAPLTFDVFGGITVVTGGKHALGYERRTPMARWDRDMYAKLMDRDFLLGIRPVPRAVEETDYAMSVLVPTELNVSALRAWTVERLRATELAKDSDRPGNARRVLPGSVGRAHWNHILHWLGYLAPLFATRISPRNNSGRAWRTFRLFFNWDSLPLFRFLQICLITLFFSAVVMLVAAYAFPTKRTTLAQRRRRQRRRAGRRR